MDVGKQAIRTDAAARHEPARGALKDDRAANARAETCLADRVGNGRKNREADGRWVKDALRHLGRHHDGPHPHGYIDRELDTAAKNLRRYRSATGGIQDYSDEEIEEHPLVTEAEDRNRRRFVASTLTATSGNDYNNRGLRELKDGGRFEFNDHWESEIGTRNPVNVARNPDAYAAFGAAQVRSGGGLVADRRGNRIYVSGTIKHGFDEETKDEQKEREAAGNFIEPETNLYNFDRGIGSGAARDLEPIGAAKPFRMRYDRVQDLDAEVDLRPNGSFLVHRAKWGAIR